MQVSVLDCFDEQLSNYYHFTNLCSRHPPGAELCPLCILYSAEGMYIFSLSSLGHPVDLLDGERWYIAISRLIFKAPTQSANKLDQLSCLFEATGVVGWTQFFSLSSEYPSPSVAEYSLWYSGIRNHLTCIMGSFLGQHLTLLIKGAGGSS